MKPVTLTDENFQNEVLQSEKPVLVDFWAEWCGPCRMVAPIVEELATEFKDTLKVGKVDVDANQKVSQEFGIRSIPTLLIFKNGKVVDQVIGAVPKRALTDKLSKHLN